MVNAKMLVFFLLLPVLFSCKYSVDPDVIFGKWSCVFVTIKGPILRGDVTFNRDKSFSWTLFTIANSVEPDRSVEINEKGVFTISEKELKIDTTLSDVKNNGRMTVQRDALLQYLKKEFRSPKTDTYNLRTLEKTSLLFYPGESRGSGFQCTRSG